MGRGRMVSELRLTGTHPYHTGTRGTGWVTRETRESSNPQEHEQKKSEDHRENTVYLDLEGLRKIHLGPRVRAPSRDIGLAASAGACVQPAGL